MAQRNAGVKHKPCLTWYEPELVVYFSRGMSLEGWF